jgi:hypothetical protein
MVRLRGVKVEVEVARGFGLEAAAMVVTNKLICAATRGAWVNGY